jgi:hypothetical protein
MKHLLGAHLLQWRLAREAFSNMDSLIRLGLAGPLPKVS